MAGDGSMSHWNYRLVKVKQGDEWYIGLYEVFYELGIPTHRTANAVRIQWPDSQFPSDTMKEWILEAWNKPVLEDAIFEN